MSSIITSTQLQGLYKQAGRPDDLFPVFDRTRSFLPWILILSVIPTLYTFQQATITESDSEWVLRSLDLLDATTVEQFLAPGGGDSAAEIRFQPPLGTWLSALCLYLIPGKSAFQAMLVSWVGTALLIVACFWIGRDLFGARAALWTVLLASGQTLILQQTQTVIPISLSLVVGFLSIRGFENHLARERTVITWQILGSGIALGVCLLLGGPVVLVIAAIQLLMCLVTIRNEKKREGVVVTSIKPTHRLFALSLLWATCFALAGWWPWMMASSYGMEFWEGWFRGAAQDSGTTALSFGDLLGQIGPLFGMACLGLGTSVWSAFKTRGRGDFHLCIWTLCGLIFWQVSLQLCGPDSLMTKSSLLLLVISLVMAAAVSFNQLTLGKMNVTAAVSVTLLALILITINDRRNTYDDPRYWISNWYGALTLVFALFLLLCFVSRSDFSPARWPRLFAGTFMVLFVFANYESGRAEIGSRRLLTPVVEQPEIQTDQLIRLRGTLAGFPLEVEQIFIVTERPQTSRFRLDVVLQHPDLPVVVVPNWESAFERLARAEQRPITAVFEWGPLGLRPRNVLSRDWKQRYLGRPQKLADTDLRLSVFFPIEK